MNLLLDSVILIDHVNGIQHETRFLRDHRERLFVSSITRAEVLAGYDEARSPEAVALLERFRFLAMDASVADEAARVRRRIRLPLADAIQAAFAIRHGLQLVTRNTKDFSARRFDFVLVPYRLG